jgi:hypothetical protein
MKKETLRKILELSKRGYDGEKDNAEAMLFMFMKKHSLTFEDLEKCEDNVIKEYEFTYKGLFEKDMLFQIFSKVINNKILKYSTPKRSRTKITFKLTYIQFVEISSMFSIYKSAWSQYQEDSFSAFINKNRLFPDITAGEDIMSNEETARISSIMRSMNITPINKMIENK